MSSATKHTFDIVSKREDERVVYGWAMVSMTPSGAPIVDLQGDMVEPDVLEKAAHEFMVASRDSGVMHDGAAIATVVASLVTTPAVTKAMGVPDGVLPVGWMIGVKVHDGPTWEKVKRGELKMFSIEGSADRLEVAA